jgi:RNA polymerase sigma-70 factor (ECF subfamily)
MSRAICDEAAIIYAGSFYRALAFGNSVANSHKQGIAALALHSTAQPPHHVEPGLAEAASRAPIPTLLTRPDTDADCIYIVQGTGSPVDVPVPVHEPRVHIEIVIDAELESFDENVLGRVMAELGRLSDDQSVQMVRVRKGSVRLTVSLSREAAKTLMELRTNGQLAQICGFDVSDVFELRAAKIKARAAIDNARTVAVDSAGMVATSSARMVTVSSAQKVAVGSPQRVVVGSHIGGFAEIAKVHVPLLYRVALRLSGNAETAEDLVQKTLLRAWHRFDQFQQGTHAETWLVAILTNVYLDDIKHLKVVRKAEPELAVREAVECELTSADISDTELYDAVHQLDPELREVVELCYFKRMRFHQAAAALNVPVGTIGTRLMRARTRLRELLMDTKPR